MIKITVLLIVVNNMATGCCKKGKCETELMSCSKTYYSKTGVC